MTTKHLLARFLTTIAVVYIVGSYTWLTFRLLFADAWWWLFFLNSLTVYLLAPSLLFSAYFLLVRRKALVIAVTPLVVILALLFGGLFMPIPSRATNHYISVMTHNVFGFNTERRDELVAILRSSAVDVIALQELDLATAEIISKDLADLYPFQTLNPANGVSGMGIISRYPAQIAKTAVPGKWLGEPQVVEVTIENQAVTIINVHSVSVVIDSLADIKQGVILREQSARQLIEFIRNLNGPVIVLGDFNMTDQNRAYRILASALNDAWRENGFGLGNTFPGGPNRYKILGLHVPSRLFRLDYVFYTDDLIATSAYLGVWDDISDHKPVVAELSFITALETIK